ncbi:hemicentin-2-like isoform X2 [Daphnia pulex]|uniref:hemicentin-2-like isoform X2 n=1 Tax=Daphnia pulex TaxID=6669 RepID=UPI001EDCD317|nr:hemicentin-2-like isoform X2 [Daphnia pulex]
MTPIIKLLTPLVSLWIGMVAASSTRNSLHNDEISAAAVDSIPSPMPSLYTRTQLVLGPALNVTVREGDKAVMPCIAPHLGDKTVSWIRQKDLAILISGDHVYTSDTRVASLHPSSSALWGLQISPVRSSDEGFYQCQVNTEPKQSHTVVLVVLEQDLKDSPSVPSLPVSTTASTGRIPKMSLKIAGNNQERTAIEGSNLVLTCSVILHEDGLHGKNIDLTWWRGNLKFNSKTAGSQVISSQAEGTTEIKAELNIGFVKLSDAGTYYCRVEPKNFQQETIKTYFLKESFVTLNVVRKHTENIAYLFMPPSVNLILIACSTVMFL